MSAEDEIHARLISYASLGARIGDRLFQGTAPTGTPLPLVEFIPISDVPINGSLGSTGTAMLRFQVDVWAYRVREMRSIAKLVYERLDGWECPDPVGSECRLDLQQFSDEPGGEAGARTLYRATQDYLFFYDEG